jgi:hypothetical protein
MDDVPNQSEKLEVALPETSQQETASHVEPTVVQEEQKAVDDKQEKNWRELRRSKAELEQKAKMQEEIIARLMSQAQMPQQAITPPARDELDSISDEDYIPKGQVKKLVAKQMEVARQVAKEEAERFYQEREKAQFLTRIKSEHPDFDEVVNPETLALLEEQNPKLAQSIAKSKDPYDMALMSYEAIKDKGLASKVSGSRRAKEVEKKIEQNAKTIQTPQAFEKRPMAQAFRMTETEKKQIYNEMMGFANQAGGGY